MIIMPPAYRSGFDSRASYQIDVEGHIPTRWRNRLQGMAVTECSQDTGTPTTTLVGELSDQAALVGVLNTLYELHLPVLSVVRMPDR